MNTQQITDGRLTAKVSEPIKVSFSQAELQDKAIDWMKEGCSKEWYYTRLGMLIDFVTDLVPKR
jgi:hypothetical protein